VFGCRVLYEARSALVMDREISSCEILQIKILLIYTFAGIVYYRTSVVQSK